MIAVLATTLALVAATAATAAASSLTLTYTCSFPLIGSENTTVTISGNFPSSMREGTTTTVSFTGTIDLPANVTQAFNLVGATTVSGTASIALVQTEGAQIVSTSLPLTVPGTKIPASGVFPLTTAGNLGLGPYSPGTVTITVGTVGLALTPLNASGQPTSLGTFSTNCTPNSGQNTTLATITVTD